MTMKEVEKRGGYGVIKPQYLLCKHCGTVVTVYAMPTGFPIRCYSCDEVEFDLVEIVE